MSNQEILDQIAKFEKGLSNPNIPESTKNTIKSKIDGLKAQLEKVEEKVEKKEEKLQAEEKKIQSELEENIVKWEKGLNNPNIPASAKEAIKKKIAAAKEEVSKQKAEIKEDVKEADKEKKEVKAAVKKLAEVAKKAGKVKGKKIPKVVVKEEQREKKSEKRQSKLKGMMDELQKLIHKNKFLASKYEGKGVDLKRDAARPAKPFGYRFTGKDNYAVPTKEQIKKGLKDGSIDYEGRPNRSDKGPKKDYKLKDGGDVDGNQNAEMVLSKAKELHHHATELENVVKPNSDVEAWEVAKMERASTDASDVTHYEDGKKGKKLEKGGEINEDGGYMAKGGFVSKGELVWRKLSNSKKMEFLHENFTPQITPRSQEILVGKDFQFLPKDVKIKLEAKYANLEGYMAKGGQLEVSKDGGMMAKGVETLMMGDEEVYIKKSSIGLEDEVCLFYKKDDSILKCISKNQLDKFIEQGKLVPKKEKGGYMAKGGMSQGYDDREDERLGMKDGKMSSKDLDSTHARRDDARFEERGKYKVGDFVIYDGIKDRILTLGDKEVELEEEGWVEKSQIKSYKKGGNLSSKAKYIPKRDIEEVEIDQNGKEVELDGADLLDGIYVKKSSYTKKKSAGRPAKKATGGEVKPKSNRKGGKSVGQIAALAKQIRKEGEKWTDAIKRASAQLKSKI